jgi:hypothetical protein
MATQEDIIKALTQLDSGNDEHWTDDGLPRVDVVQRLLKDPDVRRKDINEAQPGFSRADPKQTTEPEDVQPGDPEITPAIAANDAEEDDGFDPLDGPIDDDELRTVMERRVAQATERLQSARAATQAAREFERKCEQWENKAKQDLYRRFPPLHPSDAIKAHLEAQQRLRYERAGYAPSQIDAAMGTRGRRGWGQSARRVG